MNQNDDDAEQDELADVGGTHTEWLRNIGAIVGSEKLLDIGVVVLQVPAKNEAEAVEAGLVLAVLEDDSMVDHSNCPPGTVHKHEPLAAGRLSYFKAMSLATALVRMCSSVTPYNAEEKALTERINERLAEELARHSHPNVDGGKAVNVI